MILDFLRSNPDVVIAAAGAVLGWLGLGRSKRAQADLGATIAAALRAEVASLAPRYAGTRDALARTFSRAAFDALARVGIKASKTRDRLVALAVEQTIAEFEERVIARNLATMADAADKAAAAFTQKGSDR